jgi:30S ribosomal protein S31
MGRGDKRTRRGKIFKSSYGNVRAQGVATKKALAKKSAAIEAKGSQGKAPAAKGATEGATKPAKKPAAAAKKSKS